MARFEYKVIETNLDERHLLLWNNVLANESSIGKSWALCYETTQYYSITEGLKCLYIFILEDNITIGLAIIYLPKDSSYRDRSFITPLPCISPKSNSHASVVLKELYNYMIKISASICNNLHLASFEHDTEKSGLNLFPLRYTSNYYVYQTCIVDLRNTEVQLRANLHKYHARNIRRAEANTELDVKIFDYRSSQNHLTEAFGFAKTAHQISAGTITRSEASWNSMEQMVRSGNATISILMKLDHPISYLICFNSLGSVVGASQANIEEFEVLNPRHLLEWRTILWYKSQEFEFYELGQRYFFSHPLKSVTEKQVKMTMFKERFGGDLRARFHYVVKTDCSLLNEGNNES